MTAVRTASAMRPGDGVAWGSLERAAFEDFADVVSQLRGEALGRSSRRTILYFAPVALLVAVVYAAPVWGFVTVLGPWAFSQTTRTAQGDIVVSGVIFITVLASLLTHFGVWLGSSQPRSAAVFGSAIMSLVLGGISAGVAARRGGLAHVSDWTLWALPMVASAFVGAIVLVIQLRARTRAPERPSSVAADSEVWQSPQYLESVRATVARVRDEDQREIRADLFAAVDDLRKRGIISEVEATTAHSAPLGELAGTMAGARTRA